MTYVGNLDEDLRPSQFIFFITLDFDSLSVVQRIKPEVLSIVAVGIALTFNTV